MKQHILIKKALCFALILCALYSSSILVFAAPRTDMAKLEGVQTPQIDNSNPPEEKSDEIPVAPEINNSQERVFFPPPQLNDSYVPPQSGQQLPQQHNLLQGGVESSTTLMPPPVYRNPPPNNMMPPPNYMNGQVMSFQNQMQRMQGQLAPLVQQPMQQRQPLQGYQQFGQSLNPQNQNMLQGNANQFNLRVERPNWIPPNDYTNETMLAPYHTSNLFFWDKRGMPNRPQMVQLANSVTKYWHGFVPNPCFVLVEPLPAAPGNYVFTSQDRRAPRGWLQNTNQTSVSGFPLYRYWLDNPF